MKCPGCDTELLARERAQAMIVRGQRVTVSSFCDDCCRHATPTPGLPASLERLVSGKVDREEAARVRDATRSPFDRSGP